MGTAATDISVILKQAASETLENLAFTEVNPREDSLLQGPPDGYHGSRIDLGTLPLAELNVDPTFNEDIAKAVHRRGRRSLIRQASDRIVRNDVQQSSAFCE